MKYLKINWLFKNQYFINSNLNYIYAIGIQNNEEKDANISVLHFEQKYANFELF